MFVCECMWLSMPKDCSIGHQSPYIWNYRQAGTSWYRCWELNHLDTPTPTPNSRLYFWSVCTSWSQGLTSEANPWLKLIVGQIVLGTQKELLEEADYSLPWSFGQTIWNTDMAVSLDAREFCIKPFIKAAWKVRTHGVVHKVCVQGQKAAEKVVQQKEDENLGDTGMEGETYSQTDL